MFKGFKGFSLEYAAAIGVPIILILIMTLYAGDLIHSEPEPLFPPVDHTLEIGANYNKMLVHDTHYYEFTTTSGKECIAAPNKGLLFCFNF